MNYGPPPLTKEEMAYWANHSHNDKVRCDHCGKTPYTGHGNGSAQCCYPKSTPAPRFYSPLLPMPWDNPPKQYEYTIEPRVRG